MHHVIGDFAEIRHALALSLLHADELDVGEWHSQKVDHPLLVTRELTDVVIECRVASGVWGLQKQMIPNLPWAEEHFMERVSGEPLNPPPSHKNWPWAHQQHQTQVFPDVDDRDWAYLAALIDGEGSLRIYKRRNGDEGRPHLAISQKNHKFLQEIYELFNVGYTSVRGARQTRTPNGNTYWVTPLVWTITSKAEMNWLLTRVLPYMKLKKDLVQQCLDRLAETKPHHADKHWPPLAEPLFSHTYPERYWPKLAAGAQTPRIGIRYPYGDLKDVVRLLRKNGNTRQAYLPVWSMEDTGAVHEERIPCSLGYHFLIRDGRLSCRYYLRSCDFVRHFCDDMYMTARLMQWVAARVPGTTPGKLMAVISSLHIMKGDEVMLRQKLERGKL